MSELAYRKLTADEIASGLDALPNWTREGDEIVRTIGFESYLAGVEFVVAVAREAEALDHHPDLFIGYRKVTIRISTHSVGGLSPYDLELARRVDAIG